MAKPDNVGGGRIRSDPRKKIFPAWQISEKAVARMEFLRPLTRCLIKIFEPTKTSY
jgi:hypothetical protein